MKTTKWFVLGVVAVGLLAASVVAPAPASAQTPPNTGHLVRLLAKNFAGWNGLTGFEPLTTAPTVTNIYAQTVKTQANANVMDVLVSFTSENDDELYGIQCVVDGAPCMNGGVNAFASLFLFPAGTVILIDVGDDDILSTSYNFCQTLAKTKKNLHTVAVNLLTVDDFTVVSALDVEVTSANVKDDTLACAPGAVQGTPLI